MFGLLDTAAEYVFGEEQAEDARTHSFEMQQRAHNENKLDRDWQERMANTRYQRGVEDLKAAGLNPMLAYMNSAAPSPSGHGGVSGSTPLAHAGRSNVTAAMQSAAQIELIEAEKHKVEAEADEIRERTKNYDPQRREIESRIPKNQQDVEESRQRVAQSAVEIERIWEDIKVKGATAANLYQQTQNLIESVPQIRANISHLRALAAKESAATDEIKQRINANLPGLEKTLRELEASAERMKQPGQAAASAAADSYIGQLGAYLRQLTGIGIIAIPGRSAPRTTNIGTINNRSNR